MKDMLHTSLLQSDYSIVPIAGTDIQMIKKGKKIGYVINGFLPILPYNLGMILGSKVLVKQVLQYNKISTPQGQECASTDVPIAVQIAEQLGYPVFIRHENSHLPESGIGPIRNKVDLFAAVRKFAFVARKILVEKYLTGKEFKIFISADGWVSILKKKVESKKIFLSLPEQAPSLDVAATWSWQEASPKNIKDLQHLAERVLHAFSGAPYISFRIVETPTEMIVTDVYHTAAAHYSSIAKKGKKTQPVLDIILAHVIN
jgi:hypothetical protein